jgi:hypothetical protein
MKLKKICISLLIFSFIGVIGLYGQKQKKAEALNWQKLAPFLIDIKGWKAEGKAEGQKMAMGEFSTSQAERNYTSGKKSLNIQIVDSAYAPMVLAGYKSRAAFEMDTSEEYIKKVTIKGFTGVEHYTYKNKEAELWIAVSDRFLVKLGGENFKNSAELIKIANLLSLKKLAALAK